MIIQLRKRLKAQSTAEYAIFFGIIIAAAIGMQRYLQRGMQGRLASVSDAVGAGEYDLGDGVVLQSSGQFVPYYAETDYSTMTREQTRRRTDDVSADGSIERGTFQRIDVEDGERRESLLVD